MDYYENRPINLIAIALVLSLVFCATACGPSHEERRAKKEAERKEAAISQLAIKYNATYFPPQNIDDGVYTYELQAFFKKHTDQTVLFKGYLEDIEETEHGLIVEFMCPIGENYFLNKKGIRIRLTISENDVKRFLEGKREKTLIHSLRYFTEPDYIVVSKINNIKSSRIYKFDGTANGEEVEIESDVSTSFISTGQFINAFPIPKDANKKGSVR